MDSAYVLPMSADKGLVSSGIPALTTSLRSKIAAKELQAFKQQVCVSEGEQREQELSSPDGDVPTTVLEAQMGRPMTSAEIIKRLEKLNPNLVFERAVSDPSMMGIYLLDSRVHGGRKFLMGFEFGYSPEFTVNGKDANGRYQEKRGWRQILARLARLGYISLAGAERLFDTARGRQSCNWQRLTT